MPASNAVSFAARAGLLRRPRPPFLRRRCFTGGQRRREWIPPGSAAVRPGVDAAASRILLEAAQDHRSTAGQTGHERSMRRRSRLACRCVVAHGCRRASPRLPVKTRRARARASRRRCETDARVPRLLGRHVGGVPARTLSVRLGDAGHAEVRDAHVTAPSIITFEGLRSRCSTPRVVRRGQARAQSAGRSPPLCRPANGRCDAAATPDPRRRRTPSR